MENAQTPEHNGAQTHYTNGLLNGFHPAQASPSGGGVSAGIGGGGGGGGGSGDDSGPNCSSGHNGIENFHHLLHHQDVAHSNGSPAKRCRLRRRMDSGRKHRPRKWHRLTNGALIRHFHRRFLQQRRRITLHTFSPGSNDTTSTITQRFFDISKVLPTCD